jgi:23S rRNA (uracil1939-C5)-methyltransferase
MSRKSKNRRIKKELELEIESLSHDGRGIAHVDGKTIFVAASLPKEKVRCRVIKQHRRFDEAEMIEVLEASPERITPNCPHFALCGACSLQHLSTESQIKFKQEVLLEQLKHIGKVIPEDILLPLTAESWGYRHKARLGAKYVIKREEVLVGFREKHTNFLTDLSCLKFYIQVLVKKLLIYVTY